VRYTIRVGIDPLTLPPRIDRAAGFAFLPASAPNAKVKRYMKQSERFIGAFQKKNLPKQSLFSSKKDSLTTGGICSTGISVSFSPTVALIEFAATGN